MPVASYWTLKDTHKYICTSAHISSPSTWFTINFSIDDESKSIRPLPGYFESRSFKSSYKFAARSRALTFAHTSLIGSLEFVWDKNMQDYRSLSLLWKKGPTSNSSVAPFVYGFLPYYCHDRLLIPLSLYLWESMCMSQVRVQATMEAQAEAKESPKVKRRRAYSE